MFRWNKLFLCLAALSFVAVSAIAAVTPIADTPYSSRSAVGASTLPSGDDGSHTSTYEVTGTECGPTALDNTSVTKAACATALKTDTAKVSFEPCGDGTKSNCIYLETCASVSGTAEAVSGASTAAIATALNNINDKYTAVDNNLGYPVAYCSTGNTAYVYYSCDASYKETSEPVCSSGMAALSCNLNGAAAWKCDYKNCSSEQKNKTVGDGYTMPAEVLATVYESGKCYEVMADKTRKLRSIFSCNDEYSYTENVCTAAFDSSYAVAEVCIWGGAYRSGQNTLFTEASKLYKSCRPICPADVPLDVTFCTASGDVLNTCVSKAATADANTLVNYCGCEQNARGQDLYYNPDDCTGGKAVGGRTCNSLITKAVKYELCLPLCSSFSRTVKDSYAACIKDLNAANAATVSTTGFAAATRAVTSITDYKRYPTGTQCCRKEGTNIYDCIDEPFVIDTDGSCYPDVTYYCTNGYVNKSACDSNVQFCCQYDSKDRAIDSTCISKGNFVTDSSSGTCWAGTPLDDSFDYCTTAAGRKDPTCSKDLTTRCCSFVGASTITSDSSCSEEFVLTAETGGCIKKTSAASLDDACLKNQYDEKVSYVCSCPTDKGYKTSCGATEVVMSTCSYDGADKYICASGCAQADIDAGYVKDNIDDCKIQNTDVPVADMCYVTGGTSKQRCRCPANYKTCPSAAGIGTPCNYDGTPKYTECAGEGESVLCDDTRPLFDSSGSCTTAFGASTTATKCFWNGAEKYMCGCPSSYTVCAAGLTGGGDSCSVYQSGVTYYQYCGQACRTASDLQPVVDTVDGCTPINGDAAKTNKCVASGAVKYECLCPDGYTLTPDAEHIGIGEACTYDDGQPKYKSFSTGCPADRPLFYTEDACSFDGVKGSNVQSCYLDGVETEDNLRFYCNCPTGYQTNAACSASDSGKEGAGLMCQLEGTTAELTKYQYCYKKCNSMPGNTTNNGIFMNDDLTDNRACLWELGQGASYEACSDNHEIKNKCYCGAAYDTRLTCLTEENLSPDVTAAKPACAINGTTYYQACKPRKCDETALLVTSQSDCTRLLGSAAEFTACTKEGETLPFYECSCDTSTYKEVCKYPKVEPSGAKYCYASKYDASSNPNPDKQYMSGLCKVGALETCRRDGEIVGNNVYTVTSTESECRSKFGDGAQTHLCEDANDPDIRRYNCFYNMDEYKYTSANCPVRHVLGGGSVVRGGVRYYKECNCHPAYQAHRYNCAGILSGGGCEQDVTSSNNDGTIPAGVTTLKFYPYCTCSEDYSQVCDGERNIGVGEPCNGKYIACECKKDELPANWTDNYYGCPGGAKPTGITKPNGCGGKYYQCEASQCTWQHTKQCTGDFQIGVDGCQDNQGNIYAYKSCKCPDGWSKCESGLVGEGKPCSLDGDNYYQSCISKNECLKGEYLTCNGPLQVGVNACVKNDKTYFESCTCASGYNKKCENGETGVGSACVLDGVSYYQSCTPPAASCSSEHKEACADNQEKYDPCLTQDGKLNYKCRCPSNFTTCASTSPAEDATTCTDSAKGTLYSKCTSEDTCTEDEESVYKTCTKQQIGLGRSCTSSDGTVKYAECQDTNDCKANGYKYICSGYDGSALGTDFCIDDNGSKLYKECLCPTNYLSCSDKNVKGSPCSPLLADGTYGPTVYSTCECGSQYTETCDGNGQEPASAEDSCESIDSSGNKVTKYKACNCGSEYNKTCVESGAIPTDKGEICSEVKYVGTQKVVTEKYRSCGCGADYKYKCDGNDAGDSADNAAKYTLSGGCATVVDGEEITRYKACSCSSGYSIQCTSNIQAGADSCKTINADGSRTTLYVAGSCPEPEPEPCSPTDCSAYTLGSSAAVNAQCGHPKNYDSCYEHCSGKTTYMCLYPKNDLENTWKYTEENCPAPYELSDGKTFNFAEGFTQVRYKECKCPAEYNKTDAVCASTLASEVDGKSGQLVCAERSIPDADGNTTITPASCGPLLTVDTSDTCTDKNTNQVYGKYCRCNGISYNDNMCTTTAALLCKKATTTVWEYIKCK